jgi:hypothetical protein
MEEFIICYIRCNIILGRTIYQKEETVKRIDMILGGVWEHSDVGMISINIAKKNIW